MDRLALILLIIGGLCWGAVGIFQVDFIAQIFGGAANVVARILYTLVGLAAIWSISLLFRERDEAVHEPHREHSSI